MSTDPTPDELAPGDWTPREEALAVYLIRTGNRHLVAEILERRQPGPSDTIGAVYDVADLVVEN